MFSSFRAPSSLDYCLLSPQEQPVFLCLPGAARSGCFSVRGSFLVPHPADAWAELCISGVAYLNHRLLFLEDYEGGGWEQRTRDLELEWRGI